MSGFAAIRAALENNKPMSQRGIVLPHIDNYLREREESPRRPGFHPSQIAWAFCPRLYALLEAGVVEGFKEIPPKLQRIFDNGHKMHDRYHDYVMGAGLVLKHDILGNPKRGGYCQEIRLDHPVGLTGNADDILDIPDLFYWWVTDWKSMNPTQFAALVQPVDLHVRQLIIYLGMVTYKLDKAGLEPDKPLRGLLYYECKATQSTKEFQVEYGDAEQASFDNLIDLLTNINTAAEKMDFTIAPCTCGKHESKDWDLQTLKEQYQAGNPKRVRL